jgi:hypothetical protein
VICLTHNLLKLFRSGWQLQPAGSGIKRFQSSIAGASCAGIAIISIAAAKTSNRFLTRQQAMQHLDNSFSALLLTLNFLDFQSPTNS